MHVVFRESQGLDDTETPYDLNQTPADLIVLSFSDSDLGAFASGYKRADGNLPSVRLANLMALKHPLSVDEYIEKTLHAAKGILVRLIGGEAYWAYGLSRLYALANEYNIALAILPGDGQDDARLKELSTVPYSTWDRLKYLCDIGGAVAAQAALAQLALTAGLPAPLVVGQKTIPDFGFYDPKHGMLNEFIAQKPFIPVFFYRSYMTAADLSPVDMLIADLRRRGYDAIGVFVFSLKEQRARQWVSDWLRKYAPVAIINATAFSAQSEELSGSPLDVAGVPVFQVAFSTARQKDWKNSDRGLSPQDLAMHVVLPEVDGRIFAGVVSFKSVSKKDKNLQYARFQHKGEINHISRILDKVEAWVSLAIRPRAHIKMAIVLSTYPGQSYQMAHAVGLDALASCENLLNILQEEGYIVIPQMHIAQRLQSEHFLISLEDYYCTLKVLPSTLQKQLNDVWGPPENDPLYEDGVFKFRAFEAGNVLIALQPERSFDQDRGESYHDLERVPCHSYVAFYLALQRRVDALIHVGAHGTLEWLPGKSVALSDECWPQQLSGALPIIYPFIVNDPGEAAMAKRRIQAVTLGHLPPPLKTSETPQSLVNLERLLDEYSTADGLDPKTTTKRLVDDIRNFAKNSGIETNLGLSTETGSMEAIAAIDRFVCDIKDSQFSEGLHIFGKNEYANAEREGLLNALQGRRVEPGPSGSPYRGRSDVLPTGRNLFTTDPRAVPTHSAYTQGIKLAEELIRRHLQDFGDYPKNYIVDLWGSATMRTAGEEFAMALHLAGIAPLWDHDSGRVSGFEIIPLSQLGRPRIGVVLRVSGLFRDVFPKLAQFFEQAVTALKARVDNGDEGLDMNPYGDQVSRVFAPKPQSYGIAIDDSPELYNKEARQVAGEAWLHASSWAIDNMGSLHYDPQGIEQRLRAADGFVHVQDLPETDVLMASDYAHHQAGFVAAREALGVEVSANYHIDHTTPGTPQARSLPEEIARIVYARASNPHWINSMMQHGFRGGAEIAGTLDQMAQFAHLAQAVSPELFDQYYEASLGNEEVRAFLQAYNPEALLAMKKPFYSLVGARFVAIPKELYT